MILRTRWRAGCGLLATLLTAAPAAAQGAPDAADAASAQVVVTGSRFGARSATDSTTPVDAISREQLQQSGRVDLIQQLKIEVPSFNTPRPLGSGVGDYLVPPSLRGLGPGEVLLLVNGKRRHTSSDLNPTAIARNSIRG